MQGDRIVRFLRHEATAGTVVAGRNADLVLLDADPTTSAANLHAVSGVVCRGQALSAADPAAAKEDLRGRVD